jgi:hypothetical protein
MKMLQMKFKRPFSYMDAKHAISGHEIGHAVSRRPLTSKSSPRGGQSGTGTGFLRELLFSPLSIIPPVLHTPLIRLRRYEIFTVDSVFK